MSTTPITIGSLSLDESYAPLVNLSFEYFKTQGGEIIGGLQKFTITGVVSISDQEGIATGATVMSKLKNIRDLGKKTKCLEVSIPLFYSGMAKITNVTIEQGSDPTWINQGSFSIEISASLSSMPANSLGITIDDSVTDISKSESIEIGEDAHGYVLVGDSGLNLSKTFVLFKNQINLTCKPLCSNNGKTTPNIITILKRLVSAGPTQTAFNNYKTWKPYLQNRSLEISTEGSVVFSSDVILLPPTVTGSAFVDLEYEHSNTYESKQKIMKTSGTVTGLVPIAWSDLINLSDTSSASKISSAESVFAKIKSVLQNLDHWDGLNLELTQMPNCPREGEDSIGRCGEDTEDDNNSDCFKPRTSSISKSRTEGTITFSFEWGTVGDDNQCVEGNGKRTEVTVDITEPQATIIEHVIPDVGTLIQNLNCKSAKTIDFTSTTTDPSSDGCSKKNDCDANEAINKEIEKYIPKDAENWLIIADSKTTTSTSVSIKKKYIRKCKV